MASAYPKLRSFPNTPPGHSPATENPTSPSSRISDLPSIYLSSDNNATPAPATSTTPRPACIPSIIAGCPYQQNPFHPSRDATSFFPFPAPSFVSNFLCCFCLICNNILQMNLEQEPGNPCCASARILEGLEALWRYSTQFQQRPGPHT